MTHFGSNRVTIPTESDRCLAHLMRSEGRQICGIIIDNMARGRKKHVWVSTSSDLHHDAERDMRDIGCQANVINNCHSLDKEQRAFGLSKDFQEGAHLHPTLIIIITVVLCAAGGAGSALEPLTRCLQSRAVHDVHHAGVWRQEGVAPAADSGVVWGGLLRRLPRLRRVPQGEELRSRQGGAEHQGRAPDDR
eukprot:858556-Pyramimonas_sp.AAC.2